MEKKTILITGASGGMGTALATWFSKHDYNLALHYCQHPPALDECENIAHFKANLLVTRQISKMVASVEERFGGIDILINNAGISRSAMSWKLAESDWDETIAINLKAPFCLSKELIPSMRLKNYGRIVNISSVVAQTGMIGTVAYAASKAGLIGLTKSLAMELASSQVTVNALALGYFDTGMINDVPEAQQEGIIKRIPLGRLGETDTVCKTLEWLLSDEAGYVTAQVINLNGGLYSS